MALGDINAGKIAILMDLKSKKGTQETNGESKK